MASTVEIFERIDDVRDSETTTKLSDYTKSSGSSAENGKLCGGETFIVSVIKKSANFASSNSNQKQQQISFDNERTQARPLNTHLSESCEKKISFCISLSIPPFRTRKVESSAIIIAKIHERSTADQ